MERKYREQAATVAAAILEMASNSSSLENFESYLSFCFGEWLEKWANDVVNICRATKNWNGCDYCDYYGGTGLECWKQNGPHNCKYCEQVKRG